MAPSHVDRLWRRAQQIQYDRGGVILDIFAALVAEEAREQGRQEAQREYAEAAKCQYPSD